MKSNKNRLLVAETEAIQSYGLCLLVFCSRLAMFVVLGFSGKIKYKFWVEKPYLNVLKKYYFFLLKQPFTDTPLANRFLTQ